MKVKMKKKILLKNKSFATLSFQYIKRNAKYLSTRKGKITHPTPVQLLVFRS
jgi:hypothetical protein